MMKRSIIKISDLLGTDIRSRSNMAIVSNAINGLSRRYIVLDFSDVTFITRSFADELYTVVNQSNGMIEVYNTSGIVKSIFDAVKKGRETERVYVDDNAEVIQLQDMESLSLFCSAI